MLTDLRMKIIIQKFGMIDRQNVYAVKSIDFVKNEIEYYEGDEVKKIGINHVYAIDIKSTFPTVIISK